MFYLPLVPIFVQLMGVRMHQASHEAFERRETTVCIEVQTVCNGSLLLQVPNNFFATCGTLRYPL